MSRRSRPLKSEDESSSERMKSRRSQTPSRTSPAISRTSPAVTRRSPAVKSTSNRTPLHVESYYMSYILEKFKIKNLFDILN